MWLDERLEFADAVSVGTPNNTTVNVGDVIDLEVARDIGNGQPLYLVVQVDTAIVGTTSTVAFLLVSDSTATIATDGTATKHAESDAIAEASLVAGFQVVIPLPWEDPAYEQFLAFQVKETSSNALTAGKVNAFLTNSPSAWKSYADANN